MLGSALQENIVSLLSYDDKFSSIIRHSVAVNLYGGPYRIIALRCYDYIDQFNKPPKDHIADLLSDKLSGDTPEAQLYSDIIVSIKNAYAGINTDYVIKQLELFIRRQSLRSISVDLTKALQKDTEESLEEADRLIKQATNQGLQLFDPGTRLGDKSKALSFLDITNESFPTGIKELDKRGFGPNRKELWLGVANTKTGKTWLLIQLAKMSLMHRLRVSHITLEMSEGRAAQRYFQALFGVSKRREIHRTIKFKCDELGRVIGFDDVTISPRLALDDQGIRTKLEKVVDKWAIRQLNNIYIKQFPTGALTVHQLEAYLDNLEATQRFTPDLLIIDYPDLMKTDTDNFRLALDRIYMDLRGLAIKRNIALAVVSQSHRGAARAKTVKGDNVAEAYSKIAHADVIVTLTSTEAEKKLGLARLFVIGRNDSDGITILISQQYGIGSFVCDSAIMPGDYWERIGSEGGEET